MYLVFVAVPLVLAAGSLAHRHDTPSLGVAFAIGYFSHLVTDAVSLDPSGSVNPESILWPVVIHESSVEAIEKPVGSDATGESTGGVLEQTGDILFEAYPSLVALEPTDEDLVGLGIVVIAGLVWLFDGRPGVRELRCLVRWPITVIQS